MVPSSALALGLHKQGPVSCAFQRKALADWTRIQSSEPQEMNALDEKIRLLALG